MGSLCIEKTQIAPTMSEEVERKVIDTSSIKGIPIIWIMGGPGSGKGTQCDRICVKYGYTHMSSGDLLRNEVMSGSPRGRQIYALMADGKPVPNANVNDLLAEAMVKKASSKGFLIDAFQWILNKLKLSSVILVHLPPLFFLRQTMQSFRRGSNLGITLMIQQMQLKED